VNTIIITAITVLGPLLGAVLGYAASIKTNATSNKQALALEKMRIEHEEFTKSKERHIALLEELCSLCYQVEREIVTTLQIPVEVKNSPPTPVTLSEPINRMSVIVNLYYRDLKHTFDIYNQSLYELQILYYQYYEKVNTGKASPETTRLTLIDQKRKVDAYKEAMETLVDGIVELSQQQI